MLTIPFLRAVNAGDPNSETDETEPQLSEMEGAGLSAEGKTLLLDPATLPVHPVRQGIGEKRQTIIFYVNGQSLTLPSKEQITIGRSSLNASGAEPDVALDAFRAEQQGVSRLHARLRRAGDIVYVTDLGSRNKTYLNGLALVPHSSVSLSDGDELRLGRMAIRVTFTGANPLARFLQGLEQDTE